MLSAAYLGVNSDSVEGSGRPRRRSDRRLVMSAVVTDRSLTGSDLTDRYSGSGALIRRSSKRPFSGISSQWPVCVALLTSVAQDATGRFGRGAGTDYPAGFEVQQSLRWWLHGSGVRPVVAVCTHSAGCPKAAARIADDRLQALSGTRATGHLSRSQKLKELWIRLFVPMNGITPA